MPGRAPVPLLVLLAALAAANRPEATTDRRGKLEAHVARVVRRSLLAEKPPQDCEVRAEETHWRAPLRAVNHSRSHIAPSRRMRKRS